MARRLKSWFWNWGSYWLLTVGITLYLSWGSSFTRRHGWALSLLLDLAAASALTWFVIRFSPDRKPQAK